MLYINKIVRNKLKFRKKNNIFNTQYNKNMLLVYLNRNAYKNSTYNHPNIQEAKVIATTFHAFGFNVDIVGDLCEGIIDYSKYDLIFGAGIPFEKSFTNAHNVFRIYYAAGDHTCHRNTAELIRLQDLKNRKNKILLPRRIKHYPDWLSSSLSDAIIVIGNEWTASTYKKFYKGPVYTVNTSVYDYLSNIQINRNWSTAKQNFLWLGSYGLVLKGLDLCIESFSDLPGINLHICGPMEDDFYELYKDKLTQSNNIFYHGFVNIYSDYFKQLIERCGFILHPSASEGQSTSLITAMYSGLIPVATKESGIDLESNSFTINELDVKHIKSLIYNVAKLSKECLEEKSHNNREYTRNNHLLSHFKTSFSSTLRNIVF